MLRHTSRALRSFATQNKVGFFGLGNMGIPMATNLQAGGFDVLGYDPTEFGIANAEKAGIKTTNCFKEAAAHADFIVTALPLAAIVEEALTREGGILETAKPGCYILDASTVAPESSQKFAKMAIKNKMTFMDCPMSGGIMGAQKGTLTFMAGGGIADFDKAKPVLEAMGKNIFHCGPVGTGCVAKLTNNLILGITMVGTSEALAIGEKLGADPSVLTKIWSVSSARSHSVDAYNPRPHVLPNVPSSNNYDGGFSVALIRKDLGLAMDAAVACDAEHYLTRRAYDFYREIEKAGYAKKDFSIVYQYLVHNNDMSISGIDKPK